MPVLYYSAWGILWSSTYQSYGYTDNAGIVSLSRRNIMEQRPPFHRQLKLERERRGWSQADLAERMGTSVKTVNRWENGGNLPRPYHRQTILELFAKTPEASGLLGQT